ncbi:hypothetical protein HETIRDRAFT_411546 [Heterobasidion irregulare TC 32-1]|uniref:Uncharacterized protein n=1 Tax=Heterobasidion irregulare (strain TC 32-1) TaxID=747525 RepID=W4JW35_HETIT|nr:uncharacterized protein HETIRDRAFT_411546 [Heterobasidion irregulare TC 32-1]ETW77275.1 hypothetical protein HETIRDRAFT_411546 [Heterobasidion irregulare TC 32-1]
MGTAPVFGDGSTAIRRDTPRATRLCRGVPAIGDWDRILWRYIRHSTAEALIIRTRCRGKGASISIFDVG